jgi:CBS domain-containing protein
MQLRDLMTRRVEEIPAEATLVQAAAKMKSLDVGALPVCQNDRLVGVITDRDITVRAVAEGRDPTRTAVADAMSRDLVYCYEDDTVESAARLMEEKQIRRLPVFDRNNRAIGMVSLGDLAVRNRDDRLSGEVLERVSEPSQPHA